MNITLSHREPDLASSSLPKSDILDRQAIEPGLDLSAESPWGWNPRHLKRLSKYRADAELTPAQEALLNILLRRGTWNHSLFRLARKLYGPHYRADNLQYNLRLLTLKLELAREKILGNCQLTRSGRFLVNDEWHGREDSLMQIAESCRSDLEKHDGGEMGRFFKVFGWKDCDWHSLSSSELADKLEDALTDLHQGETGSSEPVSP